jgi:hypothetical protein
VVNTASNLATTAASYLPTSPTAAVPGATTSYSHAEEYAAHGKQLPPDAEASEVIKMNSEGLAVFEDAGVRHEVLVKINQLAM